MAQARSLGQSVGVGGEVVMGAMVMGSSEIHNRPARPSARLADVREGTVSCHSLDVRAQRAPASNFPPREEPRDEDGGRLSRLTDLIQAVRKLDPDLGKDLEAEVTPLQRRLPLGLNFERHRPEVVEIPAQVPRRGSKVRVLPARGADDSGDSRVWQVVNLAEGLVEVVDFRAQDPEVRYVPADDLVVVAEFKDAIYPGLRVDERVETSADRPFHCVINGENFHALELLTFTHTGLVDAIYIDPPYNTRANDWKYSNDFVDPDDEYAHSKWLAFMERRLKVAKRLLNPQHSALIVAIDEKEVLRLGLLLEQTFPEATVQMVTTVISAKGAVRRGQFSRVEEHLFFVTIGEATVERGSSNMLPTYREEGDEPRAVDEVEDDAEEALTPVDWLGLRRREPGSVRTSRPNQFYPVFYHVENGNIHSIGDAITPEISRISVSTPPGCVAFWPLKPDGTEMIWGLTPEVLRNHLVNGYVKVKWNKARETGTVYYLPGGTIQGIAEGRITVVGRKSDGSVEAYVGAGTSSVAPKRVWHSRSHNAETGGTAMLAALVPGRRFPYPKSLYAVEDALRFVIGGNKKAVVLDFFAGSGTTAHAVMRLNREDGGSRHSILVTNNEVSAAEALELRSEGLRPGDPDWEKHGICDWITKPRVKSAITGRTPDGRAISSRASYRYGQEFPMAEGFDENAAFMTLTYESPWGVSAGRSFAALAPLLWMHAGSDGQCISSLDGGWAVGETYAILEDLDNSTPFLTAIRLNESVRTAFIITDDERRYQMVTGELPEDVEAIRLYEDYIRNFQISMDD